MDDNSNKASNQLTRITELKEMCKVLQYTMMILTSYSKYIFATQKQCAMYIPPGPTH